MRHLGVPTASTRRRWFLSIRLRRIGTTCARTLRPGLHNKEALMTDANTRTEAQIAADLNDLLQLDHDAVQAYTLAIDDIRDQEH